MMSSPFQFEIIAEDAVLLRFGDEIAEALNAQVQRLTFVLNRTLPTLECVPAYASVLLRFDPSAWLDRDQADPYQELREAINTALSSPSATADDGREHMIPVCYGGAFGPDLDDVARHAGIPPDGVISRHTAARYRVAMIGFAPGFPYLLGMDPALAMPRRDDPRQRVAAGSVAIGGQQTGIYPTELPGGWQLIGRTPLRLFDATVSSPSLLIPGDHVRFQAIDADAFARLQMAAKP